MCIRDRNEYFVRGNCGSCKARIEKAAKEAGAISANWDAETQKVKLDFDPAKTSADLILKRIADVGHDNEKFTASDDVYKELPDCCLYDRKLPLGVKSDFVPVSYTHLDVYKRQAERHINSCVGFKTFRQITACCLQKFL